jgi:hypothetical protein
MGQHVPLSKELFGFSTAEIWQLGQSYFLVKVPAVKLAAAVQSFTHS